MTTKVCFKCNKKKPLSSFYSHPATADRHLNKCKACTKKDVDNRYYDPKYTEKIRAYEHQRNALPHRREARKKYQQWLKINRPGRWVAHLKVRKALQDGRLIKKPCEVCGEPKSQGHHSDYRKYLQVQWLCLKHHRQIHSGKISPF